jgi:hypothetical protein
MGMKNEDRKPMSDAKHIKDVKLRAKVQQSLDNWNEIHKEFTGSFAKFLSIKEAIKINVALAIEDSENRETRLASGVALRSNWKRACVDLLDKIKAANKEIKGLVGIDNIVKILSMPQGSTTTTQTTPTPAPAPAPPVVPVAPPTTPVVNNPSSSASGVIFTIIDSDGNVTKLTMEEAMKIANGADQETDDSDDEEMDQAEEKTESF